jgi:hypothetical protein
MFLIAILLFKMQIGSGGKQINGDTALRRFYRLFSFFFLFQNKVEKNRTLKKERAALSKSLNDAYSMYPENRTFLFENVCQKLKFYRFE